MVGADEIGYIAWDDLDEQDCNWLIQNANGRLAELHGNESKAMREYREWIASWRKTTVGEGPRT